MRRTQDPKYVTQQYKNADTLNARVALHRDYSVNPVKFDDWLYEQFDMSNCARVLDVGCGDARLWESWTPHLPETVRVTLADLSEGMLEAAKKRLCKSAERFEYTHCDIQALPFNDGEFDAVMAFHMLYHVPDIKKGIAELRRVLKPGGKLYATTNGESTMSELPALIKDFDKNISYPSGKEFMAFTMENGTEWLGESFKNIERRDGNSALRITAARPLMDYCFSASSFVDKDLLRERESEFEDYLNKIIAREGFIHISKHGGIFIAS